MEMCSGIGLLLIEMWFAKLIDEDSLCGIGLPSYGDSLYGLLCWWQWLIVVVDGMEGGDM